jgi:hypothetical protein
MGVENYSKENIQKAETSSKIDPWKKTIESWLEEDRKMRYKQRHTAQRIHDRLTAEYTEYDGSYTLIQRYVKKRKVEIRKDAGFLELVWHPGEAQADFGEQICWKMASKKFSSISV